MYTVTFYIGTGCNAINTADSLSKLAEFDSDTVTVSNCDIISCRNLSSFRVAVSPNAIKNADYCYVTGDNDSAVFSIEGIVPTSPDVCEVYVLIDYWLTGGGINNTSFLDGIVERHHVAKSDDTLFAYTEPDPLIGPSKPLEIEDGGIVIEYAGVHKKFIEASLAIGRMGTPTIANTAYTYQDTDSGETVTVPRTLPLNGSEDTKIQFTYPGHTGFSGIITPVTAYYDANNTAVQNGYAKCRDLGVEDAILNSWCIPNDVLMDAYTEIETDGRVEKIRSGSRIVTSGLNFVYGGSSINNNRVYAGEFNKYFIQSVATGNISEFNPEDIYHSGDTAPEVVSCADPRPEGKPYFRYQYYKGSTDFFKNCIPGMEWQKAPINFSQAKGAAIERNIFWAEHQRQEEISGFNLAAGITNIAMQAGQAVFDIANAQGGVQKAAMGNGRAASIYDYHNAQSNLAGTIYGDTTNLISSGIGLYGEQQKYNLMQASEKQKFQISQKVVIPTIMYPRSDALRDFLGNGCRVYRLRYSNSDLTKVDNILSAYGYKDNTLITSSLFTNRSKFNYIQAFGVSVNNSSIPKWIRDGMAMQLSNGIRIWHVKPNSSYYTNGQNV